MKLAIHKETLAGVELTGVESEGATESEGGTQIPLDLDRDGELALEDFAAPVEFAGATPPVGATQNK